MPNLKLKDQPSPPAERETDKTIAALQRRLHGLHENRAGAIKVSDRDPGMEQLVARLDAEIAEVEAKLRDLRGVAPEEQLAALEAELATADAALGRLRQQKTAAVAAKLRKEDGAVTRLRAVEQEITAASDRSQKLRGRHAKLRQAHDQAREDAAQHEASTTPRRVAELAENRTALAETATAAAHSLADALRHLAANGEELAELIGCQGVNGFLSDAAFRRRFQDALARPFAIDATRPLTATNSLLGIPSHAVGHRSHLTISEVELQGLDDLCAVRLTESSAEAARQRLEARGDRRIVVPIAGVFVLIPFEHIFGDQVAAERAARRAQMPMAVVPFEDGWIVVARQYTGEVE